LRARIEQSWPSPSFDGFVLALDRATLQLAADVPPALPLAMDIRLAGSDAQLTWNAKPGHNYQVLESTNLTSWQARGAILTPAFGTRELRLVVPLAASRAFFKVEEQSAR
jgi:hypothetical protein